MPLSISENIPLSTMTTFRIGGSARFFCAVRSEADLVEAVAFSREKSIPFFILGGGSNILVADEGFPGLVIKMEIMGVDFVAAEGQKKAVDAISAVKVTAGAGENWDGFVERCVARGLYGLENLSGIPGTVGASPVQNIGAYGSEVKDVIQSVRIFNAATARFADLSDSDCQFEYRDSLFKKQPGIYIVISVTFLLKKDGTVSIRYKDLQEYLSDKNNKDADTETSKDSNVSKNIQDVRDAVLAIRRRKLPDVKVIGTAGSFFKNPIIETGRYEELKQKYPDMPSYPAALADHVKIPLGWILDHVCNYKGVTKGNVGTYKNQALVLVNNGNATAHEIKGFAAELIADVKEKTGIIVEPEVQYVA